MISDTPFGKCRQEGCTVDKDGKCLEGFQVLKECPHHIAEGPASGITGDAATIADDGNLTAQVRESPGMRDLPSGLGLDYVSAATVTRSAVTRIILLAGAADSGKTTLLASLYERFQWGPFAGYLFAGSRTLLGFERRCHLARIASQRSTPDTERTKPGSAEDLLHLRVRDQDLIEPAQDILLTDLPGEVFRLVRDSSEECQKLEILRRAVTFHGYDPGRFHLY